MILFEVFGVPVHAYSLMTILGLTAAGLLVWLLLRHRRLSGTYAVWIAGFVLVGLFIGGHLLYGVTQIPYLVRAFADPAKYMPEPDGLWKVLDLAFSGLVFYGGLLGGIAAGMLTARTLHVPERRDYYDVFVAAIPLFHAFGRVGCWYGGCCYGVECESGLTDIYGVTRVPTQLIEAGFNVLLAALLVALFLRGVWRGNLMRAYFLLYPVFRFTIEFWRGDGIRGVWGPFSTSQWLSLALFTAAACSAAAGYVRRSRKV